MNAISLIEAKKKYYAELQEIAQLTHEEIKNRDFNLALLNELEKWFDTSEHTSEQVNTLSSLISNLADELDLSGIKSSEELTSFLNYFAQSIGIRTPELLQYFYGQAFVSGCIIPFGRVYQFVLSNKKEFINKTKDPNLLQGLKDILNSGEDSYIVKDCLADLSIDLGEDRSALNDLGNLYTQLAEYKEGICRNGEKNLKPFFDLVSMGVGVILRFMMGKDYLEDKLSDKERQFFYGIIKQPYIEPMLNDLMENMEKSVSEEDCEDETFTLPENYFTGIKPSENRDEYLAGSFFDTTADVYKFVELINYIADRGFIENNKATKELLAFRLSGRLRPTTQGELKKITWMGGAAHGADCLFLMKCINSKSKFSKMSNFFEADFPPLKECKDRVHSAGTDFMKKLNSLFPSIYKLPDKLK